MSIQACQFITIYLNGFNYDPLKQFRTKEFHKNDTAIIFFLITENGLPALPSVSLPLWLFFSPPHIAV